MNPYALGAPRKAAHVLSNSMPLLKLNLAIKAFLKARMLAECHKSRLPSRKLPRKVIISRYQ
jgi:hypothetical protein